MKRLFLILSVIALMITPMSLLAQNDNFYVTEDGAFAVFLPDGWSAQGDAEGLFLGTSEDTLGIIQDESDEVPIIASGEIGLVVTPFPIELFETMNVDPSGSLADILQQFATSLDPEIQTSEIMEVEVGGLPAAMVQISEDGGELAFILHRLAPEVVGFSAVVVGDNAFDEVIEDIVSGLGEVSYSLPLEEFYEDGANSVMYPAGWTSNDELIEDALIITNVPEYLELEDAELQSDEVVYVLFDVSDIAAENEGDLEATASGFAELLLSEGDVADEPGTIDVNGREVAGLSVTNEIEGEGEGGIAVTQGPDGQVYGILYATADNEGSLIAWTAVQILLSANTAEGIEG